MKIIIVGCGYVGGACATELRAAGHEVWALRRNQVEPPAPGVHMVQGDVAIGSGLEKLPRDADALVYAVSPDQRSEVSYRRAYPEGVRRLLSEVPTRRMLLVSSTSVYGEADGGWVEDDSPTAPRDFRAQCILEAERWAARGPHAAAVVRASGIYGPFRTGLVERVRNGQARAPEAEVFTNRIHRDDLARVLHFLVERPELEGTFLATDTEPIELGRLQAWLAARLGVAVPPPATGELAPTRHRSSKRCVPRRLLAAGYRFAYPTFREGYAGLLQGEN